MAKEELREFEVIKSNIKDSTGKKCLVGSIALLSEKDAQHYQNLERIKAPKITFGDSNGSDTSSTDTDSSGSKAGGAASDGVDGSGEGTSVEGRSNSEPDNGAGTVDAGKASEATKADAGTGQTKARRRRGADA